MCCLSIHSITSEGAPPLRCTLGAGNLTSQMRSLRKTKSGGVTKRGRETNQTRAIKAIRTEIEMSSPRAGLNYNMLA